MEKLKSPKQTKLTKKKPIKVVYISNPMKVKAKAADFRALVQQLTGRDSDLSDPTPGLHESNDHPKQHHNYSHKEQLPLDESVKESGSGSRSDCSLDGFEDDVYMPQLLDNLPAIFSSNWWNESTHV